MTGSACARRAVPLSPGRDWKLYRGRACAVTARSVSSQPLDPSVGLRDLSDDSAGFTGPRFVNQL
jgi:hypothetical protein